MNPRPALLTAGTIFGLAAVAHLARFFFGVRVVVQGVTAPDWYSLPAGLIAAVLAWWMFAAARGL